MAKHTTVYPMPGGVELQDETILDAVRKVDTESPLEEDLLDWFLDQGGMTSEDSAQRRVNFLKTADILKTEAKQVRLDENGIRLLQTDDTAAELYEIFDSQFLGFETILQLIQDLDTVTEIHEALLEEVGDQVDWESDQQTKRRVDYLRSFGLVEYTEGEGYRLTDRENALVGGDEPPQTRFSEPPDASSLMRKIRDDSSTPPTFYWVTQSTSHQSPQSYIRVPIENDNGLSPRDIAPGDVIIHYLDGQIMGYSTLQEPGTQTAESGSQLFRASVQFRPFTPPIDLSELIGPLTDPAEVTTEQLESSTYPFSRTGLQDCSLGRLSPEAVAQILEVGADFEQYGDLDLEIDLSRDQVPSPDEIPLHFPEETFGTILDEIADALTNGQHLILIGPPGTGKTKLAQTIADEFNTQDGHTLVTATADWSTFDTVGGYQPDRDSHLEFIPGVFLSRFQAPDSAPTNEWLIVDEINRANIDKAFGSFFSALSGDDVTTAFKESDGSEIKILGSDATDTTVRQNQYYIPESWRLIATMNTHDKMSLYDMSYAFMRRFAFIHVGAPDAAEITPELLTAYVDEWRDAPAVGDTDTSSNPPEIDSTITLTESEIEAIVSFWQTIQPNRTLGPAIIRNIAASLSDQSHSSPDLTGPLKMYVLPQLEDLPEPTQIEAIQALLAEDDIPFARERFRRFASDYFGIEARKLTGE